MVKYACSKWSHWKLTSETLRNPPDNVKNIDKRTINNMAFHVVIFRFSRIEVCINAFVDVFFAEFEIRKCKHALGANIPRIFGFQRRLKQNLKQNYHICLLPLKKPLLSHLKRTFGVEFSSCCFCSIGCSLSRSLITASKRRICSAIVSFSPTSFSLAALSSWKSDR